MLDKRCRTKIGVITTHPIQYQVPWFRAMALHPSLDLEVLFCHRASPYEQAESGFGVAFDWDVPLLEGYRYRFLRNAAAVPSLRSFSGLDTPEVQDIVAGEGFDAVMVNGWHYKSAWQAMMACWKTRTPVLVRGDSHLHTPRHFLKSAVKAIPYRWFIPRLDACLAAGRWSTEYFLHYGARQDRVFLVPHVIDEERFASEYVRLLPYRGELRRKWGLDPDDVVFLFAGKFISKKHPMDFVKAVDLAVHCDAHISGLMIGDGPLRQECQRYAKDRPAPVRFGGFLNQSEMPLAYVACDVLVLPSDGGETWGLVVNEAMACGRPCIVSDRVGCGPDLVSAGETGFVFEFENVEQLAGLMRRCASDRAALAEMSNLVRPRLARHSITAAVEGTLLALAATT